ncbi:MAG: GNAT family N-acetyltransferase [Thermoplasmatota archaeon]
MEIEPYDKEMSGKCLELEALCPQGDAYRLSFVRDTFHKRAEHFDQWQVLVARKQKKMVGVVAVALKEMDLMGRPLKGAFFFDLRVHPKYRRQGIGQKLGWTAKDWALEKGAEYHYLYCINDNRAMRALGSLVRGVEVGGYDLLVWPVYRKFKVEGRVREAAPEDVHRECFEVNGPYDLYSDPFKGGSLAGHQASFRSEGAGCSTWSNKGILEERVEGIPGKFEFYRKAMSLWPMSRMRHPHLPATGEVLRGLYVYDLYSKTPEDAVDLILNVNNRALEDGYDYLYIIDPPLSGTIDRLRKKVPKTFSPKLRYCLLSHTPDMLDKLYVDIRDL